MSANSDIVLQQTETDLTFTQIHDAPKALVFLAFSKAEHLKQWWGPPGCSVVDCDVDFRTGGQWDYTIRTDSGEDHRARAVYKDIVPNEKIEFIDYFLDANGNVIENLPSKHVTIKFDGIGNQTELTVHVQLKSAAERQQLMDMGFLQGFSTALNQLAAYEKVIEKEN
jgi:uncharacterized protein YndB with AHSA1/START domain